MIKEKNLDVQEGSGPTDLQKQLNRRDVVARNLRAIGAIVACAVVETLARPAQARTPCFLKGTRILTSSGERTIESLEAGDLLPTAFGGMRPVQLITQYRIAGPGRKRWMHDSALVCIKRSALADDLPHADLYVTPGHAVLVDGLLVPAGSLINGISIVDCATEESQDLEFFQIKLETHDVIYAEGAPCETMLRISKSDGAFPEYRRKFGIDRGRHCAPIVCNGKSAEVRSRARSALSPWLGPQKIDTIRARLEMRA